MSDSDQPDHPQYGISLIEELDTMAPESQAPAEESGQGLMLMDRLREWRPGRLLVGTTLLLVISFVGWGASKIILRHDNGTNNPPITDTSTYDNNVTNPVEILNKDNNKTKKTPTKKPKPKPSTSSSSQPSTSTTPPPATTKKSVPVPDPVPSDPGGNPFQP